MCAGVCVCESLQRCVQRCFAPRPIVVLRLSVTTLSQGVALRMRTGVSKGMQKGYGKGKVKGKGGRRVGEKKVGNITGAACDMSLGVSNNEQHSEALKEFGFHIKVKLR